jgi:hypothetical protein
MFFAFCVFWPNFKIKNWQCHSIDLSLRTLFWQFNLILSIILGPKKAVLILHIIISFFTTIPKSIILLRLFAYINFWTCHFLSALIANISFNSVLITYIFKNSLIQIIYLNFIISLFYLSFRIFFYKNYWFLIKSFSCHFVKLIYLINDFQEFDWNIFMANVVFEIWIHTKEEI